MPSDNEPNLHGCNQETLNRIKNSIEALGYSVAEELSFSVDHGVVTVRGSLPSFYQCQLVLESLKRVAGVTRVVNQIEVVTNTYSSSRPLECDLESMSTVGTIRESELHACSPSVHSSDVVTSWTGAAFHD
jgi:hypothetical protein